MTHWFDAFWESFLRIVLSFLFGGVFYFIWMVIFLLIQPKSGVFEGILWIVAPVFTGIGFALGIYLIDRLVKREKDPFLTILIWPLTGCAFGALVVYWFGPMLIVFAMLFAGTVSVILREIILLRR